MSIQSDEQLKFGIKSHISGVIRGFVIGVLILAQIAFIILISLAMTSYTVYFYVILEGASLIVMLSLLNQDKSLAYKMSWACLIVLLPISGQIMYILWGTTNTNKKMEDRVMAKINNGYKYIHGHSETNEEFYKMYPKEKRMSKYMDGKNFPLFKNNDIAYFPMGEDVFTAMFDDLEKAKKYILLEFFIVADGILWDKIHEILVRKVKQGVEVKFLYDDFGTMFRTEKRFRENLEKEGIEVRVFNPIHKYIDKLYMNFRSHQKIVVIDGNVGYTGGFNLADEYANICERFGYWKDTGVRVEGDAVWGLAVTFLQMWDVSGNDSDAIRYDDYIATKASPVNKNYCHVIADGPANNPDNPILDIYMQMISYAESYIYITTPYLIIDETMRGELIRAANSGIDVRIITPGIPDKKSIKLLTNYNYGRLLEEGIRIYEYEPGFIHAKMIVTDNSAVVGTINMDYRSFYLHYECGLWMCAPGIIHEIKKDIIDTISQSREITYEEWKERPWHVKVYQIVLNMFQTLT